MASAGPRAMDADPTELVKCGNCNQVNTVPFGLDKFACYSCGVTVSIARPPSAACAAASSAARGAMPRPPEGPSLGQGGGTTAPPPPPDAKKTSTSFFGKL